MNMQEKEILYNTLEEILIHQHLLALQMTDKERYPEPTIVKYNVINSRARLLNHLMYDLKLDRLAIDADISACKKAQEQFDKLNGG